MQVEKVSDFKSRLKEAFKLRGIKQSDIVKDLGYSKGTVSTWVSGPYEPRRERIRDLAAYLKVSMPWLEGYNVPMEESPVDYIHVTPSELLLIETYRSVPTDEKERLEQYIKFISEQVTKNETD